MQARVGPSAAWLLVEKLKIEADPTGIYELKPSTKAMGLEKSYPTPETQVIVSIRPFRWTEQISLHSKR